MTAGAADELAARVAGEMVARAFPHERAIYRAASRAYFANPNRALRRGSAKEMLGFGGESMAVLTPYALVIADAVVGEVRDEIGAGDTAMSEELASRVRELSLAKARELKLDEDTAALLTAALVDALAAVQS